MESIAVEMNTNGIRRICIYGGPGSGKSSSASRIYSELKVQHRDVELVREWIKEWAYLGRKPISYDQVFAFGNQIHREDIVLRHVDFIVTDCPLLMCCAYAKYYGAFGANSLIDIAMDFERDFPAINFYLERTVDYNDKGRYQNLDQAKEFDEHLTSFMTKYLDDNWKRVKVDDFEDICEKIESALAG